MRPSRTPAGAKSSPYERNIEAPQAVRAGAGTIRRGESKMLKRRTIVLAISAFVGFGVAMHERPAAGHAPYAPTPVAFYGR
jgi:hypothetical protein